VWYQMSVSGHSDGTPISRAYVQAASELDAGRKLIDATGNAAFSTPYGDLSIDGAPIPMTHLDVLLLGLERSPKDVIIAS
jgi:hypothetical protein